MPPKFFPKNPISHATYPLTNTLNPQLYTRHSTPNDNSAMRYPTSDRSSIRYIGHRGRQLHSLVGQQRHRQRLLLPSFKLHASTASAIQECPSQRSPAKISEGDAPFVSADPDRIVDLFNSVWTLAVLGYGDPCFTLFPCVISVGATFRGAWKRESGKTGDIQTPLTMLIESGIESFPYGAVATFRDGCF